MSIPASIAEPDGVQFVGSTPSLMIFDPDSVLCVPSKAQCTEIPKVQL
jgi:hypothetical protein